MARLNPNMFSAQKFPRSKQGDVGFDNVRDDINPTSEKKEIRSEIIVIGKGTDDGMKVDTGSPAYGWRTIQTPFFPHNTNNPTTPDFNIYRDGIRQYQFSQGDEEYLTLELPHDYKIGTDIYMGISWSHTSTTITGGSIAFQVEMTYSKGHNQSSFPSTKSIIWGSAPNFSQYGLQNSINKISTSGGSSITIDSDVFEPNGTLLLRIDLISNDLTDSVLQPDPFIHTLAVYYQSTNVPTKDKIPNFYT